MMFPRLSREKIDKLVFTYAARPYKTVKRLDTHRNGGAMDLTIVDRQEKELWMGTDHDNLTLEAALDYYGYKKSLPAFEQEAKKNRRLLKEVFLKAGLVPYAPERWHWSYNG